MEEPMTLDELADIIDKLRHDGHGAKIVMVNSYAGLFNVEGLDVDGERVEVKIND